MKSTHTIAALIIASTAVLSGCASNSTDPYNNGAYNSPVSSSMGYGTIDSIQVTRGPGQTSGAGAIVGGMVGALAGHQVGGGDGKKIATAVGAVGGALVGNQIEANRNGGGRDMYQIGIRLENGDYRTIVQDSVYDLRIGNRVRVVDGRVYRY
ncbi:glycine zipper 2TM domain-containing protein [Massilia glaciei]|uniref:Glycine zipper 2TM domain-containing protein n=1 Tax=Massilia glaciei TaxID=1524097 RepID=A0A2U2HEF4_9BURK|nr:glycine zipper 2TM domain-containing protein [Massilia glaciei]PWF41910.1 glycine zipper 2TM domain-containing protein [Massilia glaciei]